ncbi:MAG: hypothetical protein ABL999_01150 [Pyrinomonadaceae bacterium]
MSANILFTAALVSGQLLPAKSAKPTTKVPAKPARTEKPSTLKVIKEGVGIDGIVVGKSTSKDVAKKFGKVYRWEVNKKYSYQMTYDSAGVSFYFCQNDKREEIFLIEIKSPYKGKTSKGVTLGKSTKEETEKIYGKPKDGFEYPGINFYYNRYGKRNLISEIDITEKSGLRQCDAKK